jgi:hypothetical protein
MYDLRSAQAVVVRPFLWVFKWSPVYFLVEYGPMLLLGVLGLWREWRHRGIHLPLLLFGLLVLGQIFFVNTPVLPEFGLLRGNRLLPILLLVGTGLFFRDFLETGKSSRLARWGVALLLLGATPTVATDIYFSSRVSDPSNTVYVTSADRAACDWIRTHTAENDVVQGYPTYMNYSAGVKRQRYNLSLIPNFAERRTVVGEDWVARTMIVNTNPIVDSRLRDMRRMLGAAEIEQVTSVLDKYGINYLYVGPLEQKLYPRLLAILQDSPGQLRPVYTAGGVYIFRRERRLGSSFGRNETNE